MCGIAGFVDSNVFGERFGAERLLERMGASLARRGPDGSGLWTDAEVGVGLVHRRLAILDPSPAGAQPMVSPSGRYVIVFNGEIYNHLEIRQSIDSRGGAGWRGGSDTETLIAAIDIHGLEGALRLCVGMFALALYDRHDRVLYLARDRVGEKPLYYGGNGAVFIFGSELKALKQHPQFDSEIDRDALSSLLRNNVIGSSRSIYKQFKKVMPGCMLAVRLIGDSIDVVNSRYWDPICLMNSDVASFSSDSDAIDSLDLLLKRVIGRQMVADVPLGAFLSGGVDSSLIVSIMQRLGGSPIQTFTVGFDSGEHDEAKHASKVAQYLGTSHNELYVTPSDALKLIPQLPLIYDEPFADSSQIPTYLISKLASSKVKVALSGDGGDEVFMGYSRYSMVDRIWRIINKASPSTRVRFSRFISSFDVTSLNRLGYLVGIGRPIGDRVHKGAGLLLDADFSSFYRTFTSHWRDPASVVIGGGDGDNDGWFRRSEFFRDDNFRSMAFSDFVSYLPDDILVKVDRAAMAVSLETRVPLLDLEVLRFGYSLPFALKVRGNQSKWILRNLLYRYVPRDLVDRPKKGFSVPLAAWLRGPLRGWASELISPERMNAQGYLESKKVSAMWSEHLSGDRNWAPYLWSILMFQAWLEAQ